MAPFAGGSVPVTTNKEYDHWVSWICQKQEEFARRGNWRRCLTRAEITLEAGETTVLPIRFFRPNGIYMLIVDGVDWMDTENEDGQSIFIEMINDPDDDNFGRWQMRFGDEIQEDTTAILWYFSNPPKPAVPADKLLLPGDMVAYAALQEYFRTSNQQGYEDEMKSMAENRFAEYLALEGLPAKNELLTFRTSPKRIDRLAKARSYYEVRLNRNNQG